MGIIYVLLPLSLLLALIGLIGYFWSVQNGQWDDLTTPSMRILGEEEGDKPDTKPNDTELNEEIENDPL